MIEAKEEIANKLLSQGRLELGSLSCPIRDRIELPRCYEYQQFGQIREECRGDDRVGDCLRCDQKEHCAKNCRTDAPEYCHMDTVSKIAEQTFQNTAILVEKRDTETTQ
ncbi:unnamed protein product [Psylliodes chrysocephalus]|uniref:Uncharacterized protein n=1 Tax=Psylliodes chrysocephalus TaxID=3402493 RepID=A0A9P0CX71_9CUCU|nr:unnamed protein product [Psylliodes chrysocephala]